jgi:Mn-dependent DtxR family transcriptional regulator
LLWNQSRRWNGCGKWNKLDLRIPAEGTARMNEFDLLKTFCAAAEARNFKEAAARLGVSPQVVTRAIQHLEARLGETLFHRSTRQVRVTAFGEQLARQ